MASLEGGLEINFRCKDRDIGEEATGTGNDGPINNLFDTCAKHTGEELIRPGTVIDKCARQPFKALVVDQLVLLNDPS